MLWEFLRRVGRAMLLRCPRCGSGGILESWFKLIARCPRCTVQFARGEDSDYWLGAFTINLIVAQGLSLLVAMAILFIYWPDSDPAMWVGGSMIVIMPLLCFPFSRTLWLAWDLTFRPRGDDESRLEPGVSASSISAGHAGSADSISHPGKTQ